MAALAATVSAAVRHGWHHAMLEGWHDRNPHQISVRPAYNTACWAWDNKASKHRVFVGDKVLSKLARKHAQAESYIQSYLFHELAHARWTTRALPDIAKWCAENKIPYALLNFFEDARIEHRWRKHTGRAFDWLAFEEAPPVADELSAFFHMIQAEGPLPKEKGEFHTTARKFYRRVCKVGSTEALKPILKEWAEKYPVDEKALRLIMGKPAHGTDMEQALALMLDPQAMQEAIEAAEHVAGEKDKPDDDMGGAPGRGDYEGPGMVEVADCTNGRVLTDAYHPVDTIAVKRLVERMAKIFHARRGHVSSESPTRRLNVRALACGGSKIYRKKIIHRPAAVKVNLYVDLSGSMNGEPSAAARTIVAVFSELARRNCISGHLVLTVGKYSQGHVQTLKLPVPMDAIAAIEGYGNFENFEGAFRLTRRLMREAKMNFCYTDGDICDAPVDKEALHREGIYTFGIYVNSDTGDTDTAKLLQWFDKAVARNTVEDAVDELVRKATIWTGGQHQKHT